MSEEKNSAPQHFEELDLMIPDMDTESAEAEVKGILDGLPGIQAVRLVQRGAFIRYDAATMNHEQICAMIRKAGFRASTFQDSKTGKTGVSSQ
jgi:copper chaperone CopZ